MGTLAQELEHRVTVLAVPLAAEIDSFKHTTVARRIHAWSAHFFLTRFYIYSLPRPESRRTWQAFPIGMGTSAVSVCLSNLHDSSKGVRAIAVSKHRRL